MISKFKKLFQIACNSSNSLEKRSYAALELVFFPLSILVFVFLLTFFLLKVSFILDWHYSLPLSSYCDFFLHVLSAASVGYLTNYIAIEMLFKPFKPSDRFLIRHIWSQGLVPRSKDLIGIEMGKQVEEKLLDSRQISQELCDTAIEFLKNPQLITTAREKVQNLLREHETAICGFLIPEIERTLGESLRKLLTQENMQSFWVKVVEPRLNAPENRRFLAEKITQGLKSRTPEFMEMLRGMVAEYLYQYFTRIHLGHLISKGVRDGIMWAIDWPSVQAAIEKKIGSPETTERIYEELVGLGTKLRNWFLNPNSSIALEKFRDEMQEYLRSFLKNYLQESFPKWLDRIENSQELWAWIQNGLMPSAQVEIERWIQENGQGLIQEKLHISQRVQTAIEKQDVEEFYHMITNVADQHLGAIQVFGFVLGAIVGIFE